MKSTLRLAALALLVSLALALPAAAETFCANGYLWTFHSGQTPIVFSCDSTSYDSAAASDFAEAECQEAWDQVDHLVDADTFVYHLDIAPAFTWDPTMLRWVFVCQACLDGYPPAWADHLEHSIALDAGDAGGIGGGVVGGVVVGVELRDLDTQDGPNYYVDVVRGSETVQVIVDAKTGRATVVEDPPAATCSQR